MTDTQLSIMRVIEENPGIHFCDIMRKSGIKSGTLIYHLRKMVKYGKIRAIRVGSKQIAYSSTGITRKQLTMAWALRRSTPRAILLALLANNGCQFADLVDYCKKSPSTVSLSLTRIINNELVTVKKIKTKKTYHLNYDSDIASFINSNGFMLNRSPDNAEPSLAGCHGR